MVLAKVGDTEQPDSTVRIAVESFTNRSASAATPVSDLRGFVRRCWFVTMFCPVLRLHEKQAENGTEV